MLPHSLDLFDQFLMSEYQWLLRLRK
jgi:hypothetical protein